MKMIKNVTYFALLVWSLAAVAAPFEEGVNYKPVVPAQPTSNEEKIEVVEVFSYLCPHCHRFQPVIERWANQAPDNVEFVRMPAIFNSRLVIYARAFYAAEALGVLDSVHKPFFDALHMEKRAINDEQAIFDLMGELGVDVEAYQKAFRSFAVEAKVRRAAELTRRYGIEATPSVVVDGRYRMDPGMGKQGFRGVINVVDHLVEQAQTGS